MWRASREGIHDIIKTLWTSCFRWHRRRFSVLPLFMPSEEESDDSRWGGDIPPISTSTGTRFNPQHWCCLGSDFALWWPQTGLTHTSSNISCNVFPHPNQLPQEFKHRGRYDTTKPAEGTVRALCFTLSCRCHRLIRLSGRIDVVGQSGNGESRGRDAVPTPMSGWHDVADSETPRRLQRLTTGGK